MDVVVYDKLHECTVASKYQALMTFVLSDIVGSGQKARILLPVVPIPDFNLLACTGDECFTLLRERYRGDFIGMPDKRLHGLPVLYVPEPHRLVPTAGRQRLSIRGEGQSVHQRGMPAKPDYRTFCGHLP